MKDDSLNDTQENKMALRETITRPGGYCPMCDTVYIPSDRPHECVGITKSLTKEQEDYVKEKVTSKVALETNVYERTIWNEAIEAAALKIDGLSSFEYLVGAVRSLKK